MDRAIALPIGLAVVVGLVLGVAARDDTGGEPAGETDGGSAAPAEDGTDGGDAGDGHVVAVEMTDSNENVPGTVHVEVTDTVRWVNTGQVPHTVTPDDEDAWRDGVEGSGEDPSDWLAADEEEHRDRQVVAGDRGLGRRAHGEGPRRTVHAVVAQGPRPGSAPVIVARGQAGAPDTADAEQGHPSLLHPLGHRLGRGRAPPEGSLPAAGRARRPNRVQLGRAR